MCVSLLVIDTDKDLFVCVSVYVCQNNKILLAILIYVVCHNKISIIFSLITQFLIFPILMIFFSFCVYVIVIKTFIHQYNML